jgi:hypothetical protein
MGVFVGMGVTVAVGINDTIGVNVGAGKKDEHAERINTKRKMVILEGVTLFRMGCILLNYRGFCARLFHGR